MLGFLIGTACLIGLVKTLHGGHGGCHKGSGWQGGCGGPGPWGRGPFGPFDHPEGDRRASFFLRGLFRALDTTPGQEKVISEAAREVHEAASKLHGEARATRTDVAKAMRGPAFDEVLFGDLFARHDTAIETVRKAAIGALAKTHDALDERQRTKLADMIDRGPAAFWSRGWHNEREAF